MGFDICIFLLTFILLKGVHTTAGNSSIPKIEHQPSQHPLERSEFAADALYQLLIPTLTSSISTHIYTLSATVIARSGNSEKTQAKQKCLHHALMNNLQFSEYPKYQIRTFLIPTKYEYHGAYHLFFVFLQRNQAPEISKFIASDAFKLLFYSSGPLVFNTITNIPLPDSWIFIDDKYGSKSHGTTRTLLMHRDPSDLSQRPPRYRSRSRRASWPQSPSYSPVEIATPQQGAHGAQVPAAQLQALLQQLQYNEVIQSVSSHLQHDSDGDDEDSLVGGVHRSESERIFRNRSALDRRRVSFGDSGLLSESVLPLGSAIPRRRRRSVSFADQSATYRSNMDSDSELESTARSALQLPPLLDAEPECRVYIQLLFICWVSIGMLITSNVVTCLFLCWMKSSTKILREPALLTKEEEKQQILTQMQLSQEQSKHASHDTAIHYTHDRRCSKQESMNGIPPLHHSVPLKPLRQNRKQNRFPVETCSSIPSTHSKSYSYVSPLVALQQQSSQAMYSVYPMSPFLCKQKGIAQNRFQSPNVCRAVAPYFVNQEDEKEDVERPSPETSQSKRSRSFDSSLMYNHVPGTTACTKDKSADGECSVYISPSASTASKQKSPTK